MSDYVALVPLCVFFDFIQIFTGKLSIDYLVHLKYALLQNVIATRSL